MHNNEKLFIELSLRGVDFAASTLAFMEWQGKELSSVNIEDIIPKDQIDIFKERLSYYREIYRPQN